VPLYTRHQLMLLVLLVGAAALGLAVGHWRRDHPDLVERLERVDRDPEVLAPAPAREERPRPGVRRDHEAGAATRRRAAPPLESPSNQPLDVNRATAAELARVPGVGPALAERIVHARDASGPFASVDDLRRVRGVGPAKLDRLRPLLGVVTE
jgi:competence protein ComEA